jgi:hypothetical protein
MNLQDNVNSFLDCLRESGSVNMFGAAPYVAEAFGVSKQEAREFLKNWMMTFDQRHGE